MAVSEFGRSMLAVSATSIQVAVAVVWAPVLALSYSVAGEGDAPREQVTLGRAHDTTHTHTHLAPPHYNASA